MLPVLQPSHSEAAAAARQAFAGLEVSSAETSKHRVSAFPFVQPRFNSETLCFFVILIFFFFQHILPGCPRQDAWPDDRFDSGVAGKPKD